MPDNGGTSNQDVSTSLPTSGELERSLSQRVQSLYGQKLGQMPKRTVCHLFGQELVLVLEDSTTQIEQFLEHEGAAPLMLEVRDAVEQRLKQEIVQIIESILQVSVRGIMVDSATGIGRTGIVAVLSQTPSVRNPESIPKTEPYKQARKRR